MSSNAVAAAPRFTALASALIRRPPCARASQLL